MQSVIELRKQDIIRRKAVNKKAREDREQRITQADERTANRELFIKDAEEKFNEDHKDEIESFEKWKAEKDAKEREEYGEEMDDDEADATANQEPPSMP